MLLLSPLPRVLPPFVLLVSSLQCHFILLEHCWSLFTLFYFCGAVFFHVLFIFKHSPAWGSWRKRSFILIEIPLLSLSSVLLQSIKGASLFLQSNVILNIAIRAFRENYVRKHTAITTPHPRLSSTSPCWDAAAFPQPEVVQPSRVGLPPNLRASLPPSTAPVLCPHPRREGAELWDLRGGRNAGGLRWVWDKWPVKVLGKTHLGKRKERRDSDVSGKEKRGGSGKRLPDCSISTS